MRWRTSTTCALVLALLGTVATAQEQPAPAAAPDLSETVDPFIGTGGHGHTFPGATMPFGMVQLSPDTRLEGWDGCGGYHYSDEHIYGFSHTHLSGTGVSDYGDVLFMPGVGDVQWENGADGEAGYRSRFEHAREEASAGYYAVDLLDSGVRAELTATTRVGVHRYTYPGDSGHLLIDLAHRDTVIDSSIQVMSDRVIRGHRRSRAWSEDQYVYFVARFSQPFTKVLIRNDGQVVESSDGVRMGAGTDVRAVLQFATSPDVPLVVNVGISAVDAYGALQNLEAETPGFDFDVVRERARATWNRQLGKIVVEGGTEAQRRTFYTALYHTSVAPNTFSDVDGRYRGTDLKIHLAVGRTQYTVFSLWDTFRAAHPLYAITERERTRDFIRTFLAQYEDGGSLPIWELAGWYTGCMIGYHSVPVITDAWVKGIRGFDETLALKAMQAAATKPWRGIPAYREHGFIPSDEAGESVSRTLEYAYDDWCIAVFARALGDAAVAEEYGRRAQSWRNVLDPTTGFMRAKRNHRWVHPFEPAEVNQHYTEANSWQYSLFVPHDVDGLMGALGGPEALDAWLDRLFTAPTETTGRDQVDITGLIGQYAHGNEPSHHMAYLHAFAGTPWKTQARVREILDTLYSDQPDGYCGNEDCGQMSAWYVLSALGFYPVTPGTTEHVIGTPLFPRATLHLENGKTFEVRAEKASAATPYIQSATLNGRAETRPVLDYASIMGGGELVFGMGAEPSTWGSEPESRPWTGVGFEAIVTVPFVSAGERTFRDRTRVELGSIDADTTVHVSTDGGSTFAPYTAPLTLTETTTVHAYAARGEQRSTTIRAEFLKRDHQWTMTLAHPYANQYAASGDQALLDGLTGGTEWRTGDWQGFYGPDLDATIDLGEPHDIRRVSGRFLQEQRSWIWLPKHVEIHVSDNGKVWRVVASVSHELDPKLDDSVIRDLGADTSVVARYVRFVGRSVAECPRWHPGAGNPAWIFIDEIEIDATPR